MSCSKRRHAFTMLELVFVIVIMGVLAKFGVEILKQIYESYTRSVIINTLESKTETALQQIANRLRYRIKDSIIYTGTTLEWAGIAYDDWRDGTWSGIIDLADSNVSYLSSPQTSLSGSGYALVFMGANVDMTDFQNSYISVTPTTNGFTTNDLATGDDIFEFYQLTDSAYMLQISGSNLNLISDYQPWAGDTSGSAQSDLLVDDVDTFTYQKQGDMIKIELCLSSNNFGGEGDYFICKQKIIF